EPWMFGDEITGIVKKFIELRYQLLPYLYTTFWQYLDEGIPMIKSLVLYDQEDAQTHYRTDEFIYGDKIFVCPIIEPNSKGRRLYLPKGRWYNYWTNKVVIGGKEMWVDADIESMPVFVKDGSIIPKYPIQQYVGEKKFDEITLDVYYKKGKERSILFDDAHDGYDYTKGRYSLRTFKMTGKPDELIIQQHKTGKYNTGYTKFRLNLIGMPFKITKIQIDKEEIPFEEAKVNGDNVLVVDKEFSELHIL
ncbi:MAG: DUF5110 domain-containing protein, partial [Flavobacteriaceae bacterium]|nr:DUF5110 domain-containing protein [Flavobacteriaceae bacterium]